MRRLIEQTESKPINNLSRCQWPQLWGREVLRIIASLLRLRFANDWKRNTSWWFESARSWIHPALIIQAPVSLPSYKPTTESTVWPPATLSDKQNCYIWSFEFLKRFYWKMTCYTSLYMLLTQVTKLIWSVCLNWVCCKHRRWAITSTSEDQVGIIWFVSEFVTINDDHDGWLALVIKCPILYCKRLFMPSKN